MTFLIRSSIIGQSVNGKHHILHRQTRNLIIKSCLVSSRRYPLQPNLHNNLNGNTINYPLVKSLVRFNSAKATNTPTPLKDTKKELPEQVEQKALETLEKSPATELVKKVETDEKKKTLWEKIKHEAQHYWHGTKLLGYEIKVSTKLLVKLMAGYELSRRESNQLQRTIVDVVRLVPFAMFVIIPFAELLLPVALKIFPNLLPSTYESTVDKQKKLNKLKKTRKSASDYIKKTMEQSGGLKLLKKITDLERENFVQFFHCVSMGKNPSREQLIQVARLFKNDQVLDNLSRTQLVAMCKYMNLRPFGTDSILRYQIRHRLLNIIKDDKVIDYEGVDTLTIPELQMACLQRGIKTSDASPAKLRDDLETWLDLRLRQKIPSTLLILASAYTYGDKDHSIESYYDALLAVLSSIPDEVYNVAKLELSDDSKLKLDILKEQDELIEEENEREKGTVNRVKDEIKLDEYEETANDGIKVEEDDPEEKKKEEELSKTEETNEQKEAQEEKEAQQAKEAKEAKV
ncbi:Mitochondrial distribution and morphology protein 38 [Candida viswanathii]|uniref:Mitochondrial distribution and morphology protein 38 n=1 Tax=Candida viswanathii TaxID=5486 RepID=A0A367XPZ2_9ASCO|nr:Mitochondrial distribution and morphology protein 38 [Candida viswanathii]